MTGLGRRSLSKSARRAHDRPKPGIKASALPIEAQQQLRRTPGPWRLHAIEDAFEPAELVFGTADIEHRLNAYVRVVVQKCSRLPAPRRDENSCTKPDKIRRVARVLRIRRSLRGCRKNQANSDSGHQSMIPKSGNRFSAKIMLDQGTSRPRSDSISTDHDLNDASRANSQNGPRGRSPAVRMDMGQIDRASRVVPLTLPARWRRGRTVPGRSPCSRR